MTPQASTDSKIAIVLCTEGVANLVVAGALLRLMGRIPFLHICPPLRLS